MLADETAVSNKLKESVDNINLPNKISITEYIRNINI